MLATILILVGILAFLVAFEPTAPPNPRNGADGLCDD